MCDVKFEFRCKKEEKKMLYDMAEREGVKAKQLVLDSTIYRKGRSRLNAREKAAMQRMKTSLNKIGSDINVQEETGKILEEVRGLCQSLKL